MYLEGERERNHFSPNPHTWCMDPRRLADLSPGERRMLLDRTATITDIRAEVEVVVERVRTEGDRALRAYTREYDGIEVEEFEITDHLSGASDRVDPGLLGAIREAAANVRDFHAARLPADWEDLFDGRRLGRRYRPVERVGVYVPGGTAAYPSTALMGVIPAVIAGVTEVVVVTPPADPPNPVTMAALEAAGADRVFGVGGAQAVAALAYGTESVPSVSMIVGPGNRWVTAAKTLVRGTVEIDFPAGPSEILVVADETAVPRFVAADMVAQAEHDPDAAVVAVTDDARVAAEITQHVKDLAGAAGRGDVVREALANPASGVFIAESVEAAAGFAEAYAPEHLSIQTADPDAVLDRVASAGSVFIGPYAPVAAGDYASGPNHILPTGGHAKTTGGVSVDTFLRSQTIHRLDQEALAGIRETVTAIAEAEGLDAHAMSVRCRFEDDA